MLLAGLLMTTAAPLHAAEKPSQSVLPGVDEKYEIVRPAPPPEPEPDDAAPLTKRYGDWEITISGDITIDVTAGDLPPPRN